MKERKAKNSRELLGLEPVSLVIRKRWFGHDERKDVAIDQLHKKFQEEPLNSRISSSNFRNFQDLQSCRHPDLPLKSTQASIPQGQLLRSGLGLCKQVITDVTANHGSAPSHRPHHLSMSHALWKKKTRMTGYHMVEIKTALAFQTQYRRVTYL